MVTDMIWLLGIPTGTPVYTIPISCCWSFYLKLSKVNDLQWLFEYEIEYDEYLLFIVNHHYNWNQVNLLILHALFLNEIWESHILQLDHMMS